MALFKREDHTYGQVFNRHVISWGTTRDWHPYYVQDVNGWYLKLELPIPVLRRGFDPAKLSTGWIFQRPVFFVQKYKGKLHFRKGWRPICN